MLQPLNYPNLLMINSLDAKDTTNIDTTDKVDTTDRVDMADTVHNGHS